MLLNELVLLEKIYINTKQHDAILTVFQKWLSTLRIEYARDMDSMNNINAAIFNHYDTMVEKLRKSMLPTIRNIIKPYLPTEDTLKQHYAHKEQRYNKIGIVWKPEHGIDYYIGHKLSMGIYGDDSNVNGSVGDWRPMRVGKNADKTHKICNDIDLNIQYNQLAMMIMYPDESVIDSWIATLAHEITHLIQGLKSTLQGTSGRAISNSSDRREQYLSLPYEIEAFAQTVASKILVDARKYDDPLIKINAALMGIKMGRQELFGRPFFKGPEYTEFKNLFATNSTDPKVNINRQQVWRTFQKALVSKLIQYKEELQVKTK